MKASLKRAAVISLVAVQTCLLGWFIFSPGPRSSWLPYRRTLQSTTAEYAAEFTTEHIRLEDGHFVESGERYRLILRYSVCSGLINQHYSHMSAFILAKALRAEVVLPPSCYRDSFGRHYHVKAEQNDMRWFSAPLDTLLDVNATIGAWRKAGVQVHPTPPLDQEPSFVSPGDSYPLYADPEADPRLAVRLPGVYLSVQPLHELVRASRRAVADHLAWVRQAAPGALAARKVYLDLPCAFFALRTRPLARSGLAPGAALRLPFNARLQAVAGRAARVISQGGSRPFNGVHLRVEKDAGDWAIIMGGKSVIWNLYLSYLREARFGPDAPLYVATGLLSYGAGAEWEDARRRLGPYASKLVHKEQVVPEVELRGLNPEQLALLDFLILAHAGSFVGFGSSTFSFYLAEYRHLMGAPAESSFLINATRIGTDGLFAAAAVVTGNVSLGLPARRVELAAQ